ENTLAQPVKPPLRERRACLAKLVKNRLTLTLDQLVSKKPKGSRPILHSDMGWQYQQAGWCRRLEEAGVVQSMSRKGNCIDNGATEQVFGHIKDEFFRGRTWPDFESFKADLDDFVVHWNTRRRQVKLKGLTPEEFRRQSLAA
ncbi:transposase, partial [Collinsella sp. HCP3S3_D1]|uniref:transposase n=1 Tax=Collinsella sp. HCP3S3_D1 TaxID=3438934 RepID=UPI003F8B32CD